MSIDRTLQRIRAYARSSRLTKTELARAAGLSKNACIRMDRDDWSPTAKTVRRLEALIPKTFDATSSDSAQP